jgi:hypothetical protein
VLSFGARSRLVCPISSLRIFLIRPIAALTPCFEGDPFSDDVLDRLGPDPIVVNVVVPQIARGGDVVVRQWARLSLHQCGHVVSVARVEPERLVEERWYRWQHALASVTRKWTDSLALPPFLKTAARWTPTSIGKLYLPPLQS